MRRFKENFWWGAAWSFRVVVVAFAVECAALVVDGVRSDAGPVQTGLAVLIAAFVYGTTAFATAIPVGLLASYSAGREAAADLVCKLIGRASAALAATDEARRRDSMARAVAWSLQLLCSFFAALWPIKEISADVETPTYAAVLSWGAVVGAFAVSLLAWPVWIRTGRLAASLFRRPPAPGKALMAAAAGFLICAILFVVLAWKQLTSFVPWRAPLVSAGTVLAFAVLVALRRLYSPPKAVRTGAISVLAILFIAGAATSARLPRSSARAGELVAEAKGPMSPGYEALASLLDSDGDAHLDWFGQGDCAPRNSSIHPGAVDVPGDGVDQDCDGHDAERIVELPPTRHDYPAEPLPQPMPIILVTLDAVSALRLDMYGYGRVTMPKLAARAKSAAVFDWAFSHGPSTRLSVPSMMTSAYDTQIRRRKSRRTTEAWKRGNVTLADILRKNGYRTEAVAPDLYFSEKIRWIYQGFDNVDTSPATQGIRNSTGALVTKAALERLSENSHLDKLFLWVHYTDVHASWGKYTLPDGVEPFSGGSDGDVYDRMLTLLDDHLEPLLDRVQKLFELRPYVMVVAADHGEAFDDKHTKSHHGHDLSTAVTSIPLIFWSPYSEAARIEREASTIDVMPTVLNMVGIKTQQLSGDSLLPSIQGKPDVGRPLMQQFFLPENLARGKEPLVLVSVRRRGYVLHQRRTTGGESLFDYRRDPFENRDLIGSHTGVSKLLSTHRDAMLTKAYRSKKSTK